MVSFKMSYDNVISLNLSGEGPKAKSLFIFRLCRVERL